MAIYRLSLKPFSKTNFKKPAIAAMAYRSGTKIGGYNYKSKSSEILFSDIFLPAGNEKVTREKLWTDCFTAEKKCNARWGEEFTIALPKEMNQEQRENLVKEFCEYLVNKYHTAVDCNIHLPAKKERWLTNEQEKNSDEVDIGQSENFHAHIMMSCRQYENNAFSNKSDFEISRKLGKETGVGTQREQLINIRQVWEQIQNKHLKQCGIDQQVSCRSNAARGLDRVPEPKVPRVEIWKWKRGQGISDRMQDLLKVRKHNAKLKQLQQEKSMLERFLRQLPKPQPQLKPVQPIKTQPVAPLKPAVPEVVTKARNMPLYKLFDMLFNVWKYGNYLPADQVPDEEAYIYAYAICRLVGHTREDIYNFLCERLDGGKWNTEIAEYVSNIAKQGEEYALANRNKAFVLEKLEKAFKFQELGLQGQQPQQTYAPADEEPADDMDNGSSMSM